MSLFLFTHYILTETLSFSALYYTYWINFTLLLNHFVSIGAHYSIQKFYIYTLLHLFCFMDVRHQGPMWLIKYTYTKKDNMQKEQKFFLLSFQCFHSNYVIITISNKWGWSHKAIYYTKLFGCIFFFFCLYWQTFY